MRSQEGPTVKEQLPPIQSDSQQRGSRGVRKTSSGRQENGSFIYVFKLCLLPQTIECWCVLMPPLGSHIYSALRGQMPPPFPLPTVRLHANLEACCCCFPPFFKFSLCMTDIKSKAPWQQHPEVPPTKHL